MSSPSSDDAICDMPAEGEGSLKVLLRLAAGALPFRSADGHFYARVPVGDRHEVHGLKSTALRDWLIDGCLAEQGELPTDWTIRRILNVLEARARVKGGSSSVFIRVGRDHAVDDDTSSYLDLGDPSGRAVKIGAQGWSVVNRLDVHFRRPQGLLALPLPSRDGSIELLRSYVNLTESDFRLLIGWLAAALRPVGPYPVLVLHGEQGSAKSTLARIVRMLIDPWAPSLLAEPRSPHDLMITAAHGWLLVFDNISTISAWLSDGLCRLATGGGYATRTLFSSDKLSVIDAQRPVVLNGIEDFVRRGDLADRGVFLHLPPIAPSSRRGEEDLWASFNRDYPKIFGGVLDAVVGALRERPSIRLNESPRMFDFALFGEAVGRGLGWPAGSFLTAYNDNRLDATVATLEDSPVGTALLWLAHRMPKPWSGTPTKLHGRLTQLVGRKVAASAHWPKTSSALGNELRRIAPQLRMHGLSISFERTRESRFITLTATRDPIVPSPSHVTSSPIKSSSDQ